MIFKCVLCSDNSFKIVCKNCAKKYLKTKLKKNNNVYSFYDYDVMEHFNKYKYQKRGDIIYKYLSKPLAEFSKNFKFKAYLIPVDDVPKYFSHTAILANAMKSGYLTAQFGSLRAASKAKYAGKPLEYRLNNPRNFIYKGLKNVNAILIDDIKTTGITLNEAQETLKKYGVNVIFSIVLSDKSIR